ncbi:hypothetical protein HanXRQr2_Chr05g0221571 [Helianthus annuus]|uniref:Uncharacterized protein n=2 Tax=Helianthus annuus TaxID=4232 RepID=A0A9K3J0K1_HELAN|nr:cold-regulated protein 27 isoform X1 [Helianthus annuus]KAF5806444.1 hypothetical protein HanXRQr2_Chr05g0221571 [Helianthus annuus]KAJ0577641.1 hypothetical protein HanIR_Chr05g0238371 [Helianthus annuus]KAJ0923280.1 hypothetical protein HanPSC8_Chr05g0214041 [Helianthus annuus]
MNFCRRGSMPCGYPYDICHFHSSILLLIHIPPSLFIFLTDHCDMENTFPPLVTADQMCSAASETTGNDGGLNNILEQEESSFMESPKRGSSEWTDEKHSLYLKSMEDSFVNQLYNSLDTRNGTIENECSSESLSSRRIRASNRFPSGQFKVLQHGFWSRIGPRRENLGRNEANSPDVSSTNTWIRHFRNGNKQGATEEKPSLTSCDNTEVIDQNFVEEDSGVQMMKTSCSKKRKTTYAVPKSGNDQVAASFGPISCNRSH